MTEKQQATCASCQHVQIKRYGRKNLLFCQKGEGAYGQRTTRETPACPQYEARRWKAIPRTDLATGEKLKGMK